MDNLANQTYEVNNQWLMTPCQVQRRETEHDKSACYQAVIYVCIYECMDIHKSPLKVCNYPKILNQLAYFASLSE